VGTVLEKSASAAAGAEQAKSAAKSATAYLESEHSHSPRRPMTTFDESSSAEYRHVQCLIEWLPADLMAERRLQAKQFIQSRSHSFYHSEFDIGRTDVLQHRVDMGDHVPHFEQLRRHPTSQLLVIDKHVEEMLQHDVIEPAALPWCSSVVMVKEKDGTMRSCVDYRKMNQPIKKDKFPLPVWIP